SSGYASGFQHLLNASVHLLFLDELPTVGRGNAFFNRCQKTVALTQHKRGGFRQDLLHGLALVKGYLGELRFLFCGQMNFHSSSLETRWGSVKWFPWLRPVKTRYKGLCP